MNNENLENEFRYYSVKDMLGKTLQEISESMGLTDIDTGALGRNFNSVMDAINKATDIAIKLKNGDLLNSLADLKLVLADRKDEVAIVREEKAVLTKEVEVLKEELGARKIFFSTQDRRWYPESDPDRKEPPVCSGCYDSGRKINHLSDAVAHDKRLGVSFVCPVCKHES